MLTVDLFLDSIKSPETRRVYDYMLKKFMAVVDIADISVPRGI
jgi:hypothetical protein